MNLTQTEVQRYSRQIVLPGVGLEGQQRLKRARCLIVGLGGLGSPVALYLAAAGIGMLGLVDHDRVDLSNLQRQIMYREQDIGRYKVECARDQIVGLNSEVRISEYCEAIDKQNARRILDGYDVVVDCTDNRLTRYILNEICVEFKIPYIFSAIHQFDGQICTFNASVGPCYECLFPQAPPPGLIGNCSDSGVIGALPGVLGSLQAFEAIKFLLEETGNVVGRVISFDVRESKLNEFHFDKVEDCPCCGSISHSNRSEDIISRTALNACPMDSFAPTIKLAELIEMIESGDEFVLFDVRSKSEHAISNIGGRNIPLDELNPSDVASHSLNAKSVIFYCQSGIRSSRACKMLTDAGLSNVFSLSGGIANLEPAISALIAGS
ncbi:HesA/MoeB/ThiF family protein [Paraburkholderia tropica]|uniref:HesA/MoeB/ThiF family protein n=1 Tax=Paraburkholderia tropica TaxID=92647 RepID=UPI001F331370|nr:HesA/MoeB/ThiF family protein [Paraburkholderia tropica]